MNDLDGYILRLIISAIVVSVIHGIIGNKSTNGKLVAMIGGIFMTLTMISPLLKTKFFDIDEYLDSMSVDANAVVANGEELAYDSLVNIIKSNAEAYILDKAALLELNLEVEVTLNDANPPVPCAVTLQGSASPHAKKQLSNYIADELGISEDEQTWI